MSSLSKVDLKTQLQNLGIKVEGNYVRKKEVEKILKKVQAADILKFEPKKNRLQEHNKQVLDNEKKVLENEKIFKEARKIHDDKQTMQEILSESIALRKIEKYMKDFEKKTSLTPFLLEMVYNRLRDLHKQVKDQTKTS